MALSNKEWVSLVAVACGTAVVAAQFFRGASDSFAAGRENACRALSPDPVPDFLKGKPAPDFELSDAAGKKWTLASLRGRPVVLNFWATWCPPCTEEMPSMEELARNVGDKAVVLAVSVDDGWEPVKRFFANGTPLSLLLDLSKQVPKKYGTEKYPETFLIDSQGMVRQYFINKRKWDMAEAMFCIESAR